MFLSSLEPKSSLIRNDKNIRKEDEIHNQRNNMELDDEKILNLEQMPKKFTKGQSDKNKISLFEIK